MRPIQLKGHSRPVTTVVFNHDGDLLFSGAKDKNICVWFTDNGERLGTFATQGAVTSLIVDKRSRFMLSGSGDAYVRLWDVETGNEICSADMEVPVDGLAFAEGQKEFAVLCPQKMGREPRINIYSINENIKDTLTRKPSMSIPLSTANGRHKGLLYSPVNEHIYVSTDSGAVQVYDPRTGKQRGTASVHEGEIINMQYSWDGHTIVTASKDKTAKILDATSLHAITTFKSDKPVNAAAISPKMDHVIVGGGQEARDVTTVGEEGGFQVRFFHKIFETSLGMLDLGHIGPINSLAFSKDGTKMASGGEDSVVYMCQFDDEYFNKNWDE